MLAAREWSATGKPVALRTTAILLLAADSALRANEVVELDACQVLAPGRGLVIVEQGYLRSDQAKGGDRGAGPFEISRRTRDALRAWLSVAIDREWIRWPAQPRDPLFVGHRGHRGRPGHARLSKRASQWAWHELQRRAGLPEVYAFHSLRHDCATRLREAGGDAFDIKHGLRLRDVQHVALYTHAIDRHLRAPSLVAAASKL